MVNTCIRSTFHLFFTKELLPCSKEVQISSWWMKKFSCQCSLPTKTVFFVFPTSLGFLGEVKLTVSTSSPQILFLDPCNLILSSHLNSFMPPSLWNFNFYSPLFAQLDNCGVNQENITVCFIFLLKIKAYFKFNKRHPFRCIFQWVLTNACNHVTIKI